jgi:hypothetical protein
MNACYICRGCFLCLHFFSIYRIEVLKWRDQWLGGMVRFYEMVEALKRKSSRRFLLHGSRVSNCEFGILNHRDAGVWVDEKVQHGIHERFTSVIPLGGARRGMQTPPRLERKWVDDLQGLVGETRLKNFGVEK